MPLSVCLQALLLLSILFVRFPGFPNRTDGWTCRLAIFQFSLWDSPKPKPQMVVIPQDFQFSLWDSSEISFTVIYFPSSFNSLCEIHDYALYVKTLGLYSFQFSLWDSLLSGYTPIGRGLQELGLYSFQFSLWDSIIWFVFIRCIFNVIFQFSLWDSRNMCVVSVGSSRWLSILFVRFY